jgi:hypothetical protein
MADPQPATPDTNERQATQEAALAPVPDPMPETTAAADDASERLAGERYPTPRGPVATALMAVTGILLLLRAGRLLAKLVLGLRQPTEVRVTADAIHVFARTEMLGKVVREQVIVIPKAGLLRAVREVRYPRVGMYAGLIALALGSYVGVGLVVDGLRAASL